MPLIDDKDKNRFTRQLEITSGGTEYLYFAVSGSDGSTVDGYGDIQIFSFINVNCAAT